MSIGGAIAIMLVASSFYAGISYQKSQEPVRGGFGAGQGQRGQRVGAGFTAGEIFSKDETGFTVKMQDGSTRIVFTSTSTPVMKSTNGSAIDLAVGTNVMVSGKANADGSITADSVQIRPAGTPQGRNR
jgi:hypothetical protein